MNQPSGEKGLFTMESVRTDTVTDTGNKKTDKIRVVKNPQGIGNPSDLLPKRLFTLKEAAVYMGKTLWGMRQLVWQGRIQIVRDGRKMLVDIKDLDSYIEKNKITYH